MNYGLQVVIVLAAAVAGMCGIHRASDRQQRQLESRCHCTCVHLSLDDPDTFRDWVSGQDPTLTGAWGGGVWKCGA